MPARSSSRLDENIQELCVTPTTTRIFSFSAVTWNRHRIHYDKDAAIAEGHRDVVVQRALLGNYLAAMLEEWLGRNGTVRKLSWNVLNSAYPGRELRCTGRATLDGHTAHCSLVIASEGGVVVATGQAECALVEGT